MRGRDIRGCGRDFPLLTIHDVVQCHYWLRQRPGIEEVGLCIGGSCRGASGYGDGGTAQREDQTDGTTGVKCQRNSMDYCTHGLFHPRSCNGYFLIVKK
ncbi:MAG TPA: hypothetical protein ENJ20_03945 [Bacteroidetes bacterium]|nr:hypothetical protein [Bacteroidota bacterium]